MHICCIYVKENRVIVSGNLDEFGDNIGVAIPMGISYISSCLKLAGYTTEMLFYNVHKEKIYERIKDTDKLVLLSITSENDYEICKSVIRKIKKKYPKIKVGVGGPYPTLVPETIMANKDIDMVCIGEGEIADVEYARQVEEGKYKKTDNLWIRDNDGQIIKCDRSVVIEDIDSLPYPDRESWIEIYNNSFKQKQLVAYILLERGCNNRCIYCSHHVLIKKQEGKYLRYRKIDKIMEELEYLTSKYTYTETVRFMADNALSNPKYFIELCQKIIEFNEKREKAGIRKLFFSFSINITPKLVEQREYLVYLMKKANVNFINLALESVSLEIRNKLNRPYYTNEDFILFAQALKKAKTIKFSVNLLYSPILFRTRKIYKETIDCLAKVNMSILQISWLTAYKGTVLYEKYNDKLVLYDNAKFIDRWKFKTLKYRVFYKIYGLKKYSPIYDVIFFIKESILLFIEKIKKFRDEFYIKRAKINLDNKKYKQALKCFNKIKKIEDRYWIYGDMAIAKMNIGDYEGALKFFDKALEFELKEVYEQKKQECLKLLKGN